MYIHACTCKQPTCTSYLRRVDVRVQECPKLCRHDLLTWVWPVGMDVHVECPGGTHKDVNGQCRDDVGLSGYDAGSMESLGTNGCDELGPIDDRQTLFISKVMSSYIDLQYYNIRL